MVRGIIRRIFGDPSCPEKFCEVLRELRGKAGLRQGDLGKRINYGHATIAAWEHRDHDPPDLPVRLTVVRDIIEALELAPSSTDATRLIRAYACDILKSRGFD